MEQSRKTCSPVKKYTLFTCIEGVASKHTTAITLALFYIHICTFQIGQMVFAVAQKLLSKRIRFVCTHTKCDGISVELSISVIHNKTTNKRANEQADDERKAEDETKAK